MNPNAKTLPLSELATFKSGGTPSKSRNDYWGGDLPWVSAKDLKSPEVVDSIDHLSQTGFAAAKIAPAGSLLILVRGMTLHKDVPVCIAGRDVAFNQDIKALIVSEKIYPQYLLYFLHSKKNRLLDLVDSAGHGTGRLNTDSLKAFPVLVPPFPEQTAIADLLSTWDVAIEKIGKLIAAKKNRKLWLMQQLLTGRKRLHGFSAPWKEYQLGDLFTERSETEYQHLQLLSITREEGVVPRNETDRKDTSSADKSRYLRICPGDIGYNTMRMWQGVSALSLLEGIVSPAYTVCTPNKGVDGEYMAYFFKLPKTIHLFYRYSQGLTSDTWNLKFRHFREIKVSIPEYDEQKKIARIIRGCEEEIRLWRRMLDAYDQQKRGLMQKLLTGKWRIRCLDSCNEP